jgi:hypothetical protein
VHFVVVFNLTCFARDPPSPCGLRRARQVRPFRAPLPAAVARHLAGVRDGTDRRHVHREVDGRRTRRRNNFSSQTSAWGLTKRRGRRLTSQAIGVLLRNRLYAGIVDVREYGVRARRGDFEPLISGNDASQNEQPDPDFRYRSNARARGSSANLTRTSKCQGRPSAVWEQCPALCAARRALTFDVTPV